MKPEQCILNIKVTYFFKNKKTIKCTLKNGANIPAILCLLIFRTMIKYSFFNYLLYSY